MVPNLTALLFCYLRFLNANRSFFSHLGTKKFGGHLGPKNYRLYTKGEPER